MICEGINKNRIFNVAAYIRLSQEDEDVESESNSVTSQKEIINQYINKRENFKIVDTYIDDGFTGTNFNRPKFQKLLIDIEDKKIDTVIVKDLSRLGRNYVEVGKYLEEYFPKNNIRFIAINDNMDSLDRIYSNDMMRTFRTLLNDEYSRDISNKVRTVLYSKMKNGEYISSSVPYGYKRSNKDRYRLEIDTETSNNVKRIFDLAIKGKSCKYIADYLGKIGVMNPSSYKESKQIKTRKFQESTKDKYHWDSSYILEILKNRVYCGDTVQRKYRKISYKINKKVKNDVKDWITIEDTHQAIIDKEIFNKLNNNLLNKIERVNDDGNYDLFSGLVRCADCGRGMNKYGNRVNKKTGKKTYTLYCGYYMKSKGKVCSKHSIGSEKLKEVVLETIKIQIDLILNIKEELKSISQNKKIDFNSKFLKTNLEELKKELLKKIEYKKELYFDWKNELLSKEDFFEYKSTYENDIEIIETKIEEIEKEIAEQNIIENKSIKWILEYEKYKNCNELTREMLVNLIDMIYIHENKNIDIKFKYNDIYKSTIKFIEKCKNESEDL